MEQIRKQTFYKNLRQDIKSSTEDLFALNRHIFILEKFQMLTFIFAIIVVVINYEAFLGKFSAEDFVEVLVSLILILIIEKPLTNIRKDYDKKRGQIRSKCIVKICNCHGYCSCKDEYVVYLKNQGIDIMK